MAMDDIAGARKADGRNGEADESKEHENDSTTRVKLNEK